MNERSSRLDDDGDLIVVAVAKPVEWHGASMEGTVVAELVKLFANHRVATLNSVGLLLTIAGILLLFLYGMPYQTRTGGVIQFEADNPRDQNQIELERWYDRLGWLGLVYVALGTFYQVAANWL